MFYVFLSCLATSCLFITAWAVHVHFLYKRFHNDITAIKQYQLAVLGQIWQISNKSSSQYNAQVVCPYVAEQMRKISQ